jgi:hypothetical protein
VGDELGYGLHSQLTEDHASVAHAATFLAEIDAQPWLGDLKCRVQHYGYRYDYQARGAALRQGEGLRAFSAGMLAVLI